MHKKNIATGAVIAALYVVLTLINPLSYGAINFRISDVLPVMALYKKEWAIGVSIGMIIANAFSPFGIFDVCVAILICVINYLITVPIKKIYIRISILIATTSAIVAAEISLITSSPFFLTLLGMLISQVVMSVIGYQLYQNTFKFFAS